MHKRRSFLKLIANKFILLFSAKASIYFVSAFSYEKFGNMIAGAKTGPCYWGSTAPTSAGCEPITSFVEFPWSVSGQPCSTDGQTIPKRQKLSNSCPSGQHYVRYGVATCSCN